MTTTVADKVNSSDRQALQRAGSFCTGRHNEMTATTPRYVFRTNLNCRSCVAAVRPHLDAEPTIEAWSVDTSHPDKPLTVSGADLLPQTVERLVSAGGFRVLGTLELPATAATLVVLPSTVKEPVPETRTFWQTYRPLLLIVGYLLLVTALVEVRAGEFQWTRAMNSFMGGFFLVFSFFKLLDWSGFARAYQTYDLVARQSLAYAYVYPLIELLLGVAYVTGVAPTVTNTATLIVMMVGLVGVAQAVWSRRTIQCACLGTVFNLPMSTVTLVEDGVMAAMAAVMLLMKGG